MTETLLLLSGQTVILTSDEAESLVQNGAAAIRGISSHGSASLQGADSKDIFVPITATACNISQSSDIQITNPLDSRGLQSNFVQVKVDGKEIPGFVLDGSGNTASGQDSVNHQQNGYGLLTSDKHASATVVTTEANDTISSTEFLQLDRSSATNGISKSSSYNSSNKENFGRQVYPLSSGGDLMHTQVEQPSVVSELGGIHSIVKLPLVTNDVQNVEHNNKVPSVNSDKQPESGHRIVAIIHGDDGSSQSIEIPVDGEAYQFNVPHLMTQEISDSQQLTESDKKLEETSIPDQGMGDNTSQIFKLSCNDESLQSKLSNNTSFFIGDSGEKVIINIANSEEISNKNNEVGLEPIFIIPDYSTDNNIPTIQIRNTESDNTVSGLRNDSIGLKASPVMPSTEAMNYTRTVPEKRPSAKSLLFPNTNRSEDKLSKMLRFQNPNKNSNTSQAKHGDWKKVMTKVRSVPKVPGSKYLRNIAKRTKFQNLASLLDAKQCEGGSLLLKDSAPASASQVNESIVRAVVAESGTFTGNCEGNLLQNTSHIMNGSPLGNGKDEALPSHLSSWNSSIISPAVNISHNNVCKEEKPLTIRISTGSIYESDAATRGDMAFSPIPSIKCEGNDGPAENSPPLTSIVYFSSEGDEPPQILQLPTGDSTKPLGSKENPIQLVQQGNTFQALQPVHKEQLEQITSLLQQRRLTVPLTAHHDEIYDPKTNMKIVYKVVHPESFREESGISEDSDDAPESIATVPKKRKRGRPSVKSKMTKIESTSELEDVKVDVLEPEEETKLKVSRTRSGRISRPPQHKLTDFRHLLHAGAKDTYLEYKIQEEDLKQPEQVFYSLELTRKKRKVVNDTLRLRYSCYTCKKIFVGRIERHYEKFPNHRRDPSLPEDNANQSYSAIKALSDPPKADSKDEGVGKPVLSPTPGTQASEMNGEPSLPIETSATVLDGRENGLVPGTPQIKPLSESSQQNNGLGFMETQEPKSVQNEPFGLGDALPNFEPVSQTAPPNSRNKRARGKGRRRGRGSWARSSNSAPTQQVVTESVKVETKAAPLLSLPPPPPPPPPEPSNTLGQILCSYSTRDIINAVAKHLSESLTPWKFLCALADQRSPDSSIHQWQERLDTLHTLLSHCKEECKTMLDQTPGVKASDSSSCEDCSKKKKRNDLQNKKSKEKVEPQDVNILSFEDLIKDAVSPVKPEVLDHIQVYDDVANALGMAGGCYTLKQQVNRLPTSVASLLDSCTTPSNMNDSLHLTATDSLVSGSCPVPTVSGSCLIDTRFNSPKAETTMCLSDHNSKHSIGVKQNEIEREKQIITNNANTEKSLLDKSGFAALSKVEDCCEVQSFNTGNFSGKSNEQMDVSSNDLITSSASNLHLPSFSVSSESNVMPHNHLQTPGLSSSSLLTTCDVSTLTTSLSSSSISMLLNNEALMNGTTSTMSISAPCVTPAPAVSSTSSSLSLEVPHFSSGTSNSENPMSGCMTMSNVDNSMMNMSSIPQVNPMQQIPIGDLDITAEDLPRLLSEGMGMVVGSGGDNTGDGCDAPKLLDTSGDTTDLSEMLFKLQEATVGISQNQDPSVYTGQMMPSSSVQQMNVHSGQLITSQSLSTPPGSGLTSQGYNEMGQTINPHHPTNMGGKSMPMQNSTGSSAPLLTFTGALSTNSDYCSVSQSINQQPINSIGDIKGHEDLIGPASNDPCDHLGKNNAGLVDRDTMNLNFPVNSLSSSELEDILKR
ncbi:serine-rich adhesin for platelets-like [Palaemon carinicauda]|uniref:serine-rich adhesin for platelets-like n=1 Tax=Palaemon carinicauda TaxID=392227 RepID=UPI0035B62140